MRLTAPLTMAADVLIIAVADLPAPQRAQIAGQGEFAITRTHGRMPSLLVDAPAVELLGEFRQGSTIVEAILRYSRREHRDPEVVLEASYPVLRRFIAAGCLGDGADERRGSLAVGDRIAGGTVVRALRVLDDSELYQLEREDGSLGALKLVGAGSALARRGVHEREARVLARLRGHPSPLLLGTGAHEAGPWLALEWCDGVPIPVAAARARSAPGDARIHDLCARVVEAYATLHVRGIVHGDIHPGNVLVDRSGAVRLLDFGLAWEVDHQDNPPRGGVAPFFDPAYATAQLAGTEAPAVTPASDQYSLAALLYLLVTGTHHVDHVLDRDELLRRIVEDEPVPFVRRGRPPWPAFEAALRRALRQDAADRFDTVVDFAAAIVAARPSDGNAARAVHDTLQIVLDDVLARASPGGTWFELGVGPPSCSVAYGAAGLALAIHGIAALRDDPRLLALADEWAVRAARDADRADAFDSEAMELDERRTGSISAYHRRSGVHAAQAIVAVALDDELAARRALHDFVASSDLPCELLDLALGRSGTAHVSAILLDMIDGRWPAQALTDCGRNAAAGVWDDITAMPPIGDGGAVVHLGVAHGWAGLLLAQLRWSETSGDDLPAGLGDRLDQLVALGRPHGLGLVWPWSHDPTGRQRVRAVAGWCNGAAGFVHLFTTAHRVLADDHWLDLADRAAISAHRAAQRVGQLCCGLAGQSYALLDLYQHTGDGRHLAAARDLATRASASTSATNANDPLVASLHKGQVGIASLAAAIERPELAATPLFGIVH